jgi:hypothetical protein
MFRLASPFLVAVGSFSFGWVAHELTDLWHHVGDWPIIRAIFHRHLEEE